MKLTSYSNNFQKLLNQKLCPKSKQNKPAQKDVSFGSGIELLLCGVAAFPCAMYALRGTSRLSRETRRTEYNPKITPKNGWADNVKVLASNSQRYKSWSLDEKEFSKVNALTYDIYSDELLNNLKQNNIKNIIEAHKQINNLTVNNTLASGYTIDPKKYPKSNEFPLTTPNDIDCWNKDDKTKQRFILAISGSEDENLHDIKAFSSEIKKIYDIPESNIIKLIFPDKDDVKKGLKALEEKVKDLNKDNAEVLIYYAGHGGVKNHTLFGWTSHLKKEGAAKGRTEVGLKEEDLKKFTKEKLNGINTLIVMDTCHSGAWIC